MSRGSVVVSARAVLYVNGHPYAKCSSLEYNVDSAHKEVRGLDSMIPFELAPTIVRVTFRMNLYKTNMDGGVEGAGMSAPPENLSNLKYFSLILVDRLTDTTIFRVDAARISNQSWSVGAKQIITGSISGQGFTFGNEVSPSG